MILNDPSLFEEWKCDIKTMAHRIIDMRKTLYDILTKELKTPGNWDHVLNQIGMFRCVYLRTTYNYAVSDASQFHWHQP